MIKKLTFTIAIAVLGLASIPSIKPVSAYAEGSEEAVLSSEVISSEEEASSQEAKPFNVEDIIIDGKTIAQWKKELADEQTRNAAIMALVWTGVTAIILILKWLADRGLLKKANVSALNSMNNADVTKAKIEEFSVAMKESLEEQKKQLEEQVENAKQERKSLLEAYERTQAELIYYREQVESLKDVLLVITQTDPNLVAAGTYKKAMKILENKDGEN